MGIIKKGKDYYIEFSTYVMKDGKKHRVRRKEKVGPFRQLAEAAWNKHSLEHAEKKFLGKKISKKLTLEEFSVSYLEYSKNNNKASGHERDQYSLLQLKKAFGGTLLEDITMVKVEEYKAGRIDLVKPATVNRELQCLRALLNVAVEWDILTQNPVKKIRLFKEPPAIVRYLLLCEIITLLRECSKRIRPLVIVALYTGLRFSEILGLHWADIDFDQGIIHVLWNCYRGKMSSTKDNERRDIPMSEEVRAELELLPRLNDRIFGDIISVRTAFRNALTRSGIKKFRFHDLRHTFASHLAMNGVSLLVIKELLGHASLEMTLRYAHLCPDMRKDAIAKLSQVLKNDPQG